MKPSESHPSLTHFLRQFLVGMGSTMELCPSDPPPAVQSNPEDRLRQSWERTGAAIQQSIEQFDREAAA